MAAPAIFMRSSNDIVILGLCSKFVYGTWAIFEDIPSRKTKQVAPLDITPGNKNPRPATRGEASRKFHGKSRAVNKYVASNHW
jgi:hypothetical protein